MSISLQQHSWNATPCCSVTNRFLEVCRRQWDLDPQEVGTCNHGGCHVRPRPWFHCKESPLLISSQFSSCYYALVHELLSRQLYFHYNFVFIFSNTVSFLDHDNYKHLRKSNLKVFGIFYKYLIDIVYKIITKIILNSHPIIFKD